MVTPRHWREDYIILHSQILPKTYFTEDNTILHSHRYFTADHSGEHSWDAVHLASEILIITIGYVYLYFNTLYFQCTVNSASLYVTALYFHALISTLQVLAIPNKPLPHCGAPGTCADQRLGWRNTSKTQSTNLLRSTFVYGTKGTMARKEFIISVGNKAVKQRPSLI